MLNFDASLREENIVVSISNGARTGPGRRRSGAGRGGVGWDGVVGSRGEEHCRGEAEKRRAIHRQAETEEPVKRVGIVR